MKKVMFFCDNCRELIATQRLYRGLQEEKHLYPMGAGGHEWCENCIAKFDKYLLDDPDINNTEYEHGK